MALLTSPSGGWTTGGWKGRDANSFAALDPQLERLLGSGGDADIWPDFESGRTRYGTTAGPAPHEIWFSSTCAQAIGQRAFDDTRATLARLLRAPGAEPLSIAAWCDDIRTRLAHAFGAEDACLVLTPGAAEAREFARAIAQCLLGANLVEIASPPTECTRFKLLSAYADVRIVALRSPDGEPRDTHQMDCDALDICDDALRAGLPVLLHALNTSKSGLAGVSRGAAKALLRLAPSRALVLVDASEGRIYPNEVRRYLSDGMLVMLGGSQFFGGPAFSGALLVPRALVEALPPTRPEGVALPQCARLDVGAPLRNVLTTATAASVNIGLGLRWTAALVELDNYLSIPSETRRDVLEIFSRKVRARAGRSGCVQLAPMAQDPGEDPLRESIVALMPATPPGPRRPLEQAASIRAALMRPGGDGPEKRAVCHVGRPVPVGENAALPLSASAPMVCAVARRMQLGASFEQAMMPVLRDVETVFRKWEAIAG